MMRKFGNKQLRIPSLPLHAQDKFPPSQLQNRPKQGSPPKQKKFEHNGSERKPHWWINFMTVKLTSKQDLLANKSGYCRTNSDRNRLDGQMEHLIETKVRNVEGGLSALK